MRWREGGWVRDRTYGQKRQEDGDGGEGNGVQETSAPTLTRLRKSCSARMAALV